MAKFIPIDKMKKLREASKSGDERAKKILSMQLGGTEDFSSLLDDYFKPQVAESTTGATATNGLGDTKPTINPKLAEFLKTNGVEEGNPEYDSYVEDFYKENPNLRVEKATNGGEQKHYGLLDKLIREELDAIRSYSEAILEIMGCDSISDTEKRGIISRLEEIKRDEAEHFDELKRLKENSNKKQEKNEGIIE